MRVVGFMLAARDEGMHRKKRLKIVQRFLCGALDAMSEFAGKGHEVDLQIRIDNAPPLIRAPVGLGWLVAIAA
ncbi:MAG TPA: hypothetical protein VMM76_04210 [Pirellulaceae bacterium]|nr:hypothetical protein [Pirellulaceae bacterium]